ncbi:MAG: ribonuclease III domain-containing protein, partial [Bacteroidota bacterium]
MFYLYKQLTGFFPNDIEIYQMAFSHSSAYVKNRNNQIVNNERLEFLGDAIFEAMISDYLYRKYSDKNEGFLSQMRAKIVNRECLNEIAVKMNLDDFLKVSIDNLSNSKDIFGNTLEALIGAVFIDHGYKKTTRFISNRIIKNHLNLADLEEKEINFKGRIFEWAQKNKKELSFSTTETFNFQNHHLFSCEFKDGDSILGFG